MYKLIYKNGKMNKDFLFKTTDEAVDEICHLTEESPEFMKQVKNTNDFIYMLDCISENRYSESIEEINDIVQLYFEDNNILGIEIKVFRVGTLLAHINAFDINEENLKQWLNLSDYNVKQIEEGSLNFERYTVTLMNALYDDWNRRVPCRWVISVEKQFETYILNDDGETYGDCYFLAETLIQYEQRKEDMKISLIPLDPECSDILEEGTFINLM